MQDKEKADRFNEGKLRWSLVDFDALTPLVRVLEFGAEKYDDNNWKKGQSVIELTDCLQRHLNELKSCRDVDEESKCGHIGHILANAMFISYMLEFKPEFDDRFRDDNKLK